jgi:hypothetical protein
MPTTTEAPDVFCPMAVHVLVDAHETPVTALKVEGSVGSAQDLPVLIVTRSGALPPMLVSGVPPAMHSAVLGQAIEVVTSLLRTTVHLAPVSVVVARVYPDPLDR